MEIFNKDQFKINIHVTITIEHVPAKPPAKPANTSARTALPHSGVIASAGYNVVNRTLTLEFRESGRVYEYAKVPAYVYDELMDDSSPGRYFNYYIKDKYPTCEVTP